MNNAFKCILLSIQQLIKNANLLIASFTIRNNKFGYRNFHCFFLIVIIAILIFNTSISYSEEAKSSDSILIFKPFVRKIEEEHINKTKVIKDFEEKKKNDDPIVGSINFLDLFECKNMVYKRGIFIWFPENYSKDCTYSVLYFHDAQNLFIPSESFSGYDLKVDETVNRLIKSNQIKPCIVVGIPSSPKRVEELNYETCDGKAYSDFIINEVMPFIKNKFPVSKRREDHIIAGTSLGGLMSIQMAFYNPKKFGGAICMSSVFHRKKSNILKNMSEMKKINQNVKFYIDAGDFETVKSENEDIYSLCKEMKNILISKGYKENVNLKYYIHNGGLHNEKSWSERLEIPLTFFLTPK